MTSYKVSRGLREYHENKKGTNHNDGEQNPKADQLLSNARFFQMVVYHLP